MSVRRIHVNILGVGDFITVGRITTGIAGTVIASIAAGVSQWRILLMMTAWNAIHGYNLAFRVHIL